MKIGNLELENNLILAPMAGVNDLPFRIICKKYGNPCLVCNEMVSAKAICYGDDKTLKMLETNEYERPISMQIFGSDPEFMGKAAAKISEIADIVDVNLGCPAPKVVKNGDGSKLLLNLPLIEQILQEVVKNSTKPVTCKIRKGWDDEHIVAVDVAKIAEKCGVDAIIVHGRTREQQYSGKADWDIINQVKQAVSIPVIGNGDIVSPETAKQMIDETGCDGIMVGRAALGNPWLLAQINSYLQTGKKISEPSIQERFRVLKEHFDLLVENKGEYVATREIRKFVAWYSKGIPNASFLREKINQLESIEDFNKIIDDYVFLNKSY